MNSFRYYSDLDRHPFTGERKVNFKAKVTEKESLKKFFSETVGTKWIQNVTPGKVYEIYKVEGFTLKMILEKNSIWLISFLRR